MAGRAKRWVKRWLRLPADPRPPAGSPESVRVFHPGLGYFRYAFGRWGLRQVGILIGFLLAFTLGSSFFGWASIESKSVAEWVDRMPALLVSLAKGLRLIDIQPVPDAPDSSRVSFGPGLFWLEVFGLALYLVQVPLTYTMVRLDYELRFYIVTDRSLRIREGITALRESTMTFDNIQSVTIQQGPVQRLFGISDLRVRTAGGGAGEGKEELEQLVEEAEQMHIVYFRGVDNAESIRDTILTRLKALKSAGLGDPEEPAPRDDSAMVVDAARRVLDETRALRAQLTSS